MSGHLAEQGRNRPPSSTELPFHLLHGATCFSLAARPRFLVESALTCLTRNRLLILSSLSI